MPLPGNAAVVSNGSAGPPAQQGEALPVFRPFAVCVDPAVCCKVVGLASSPERWGVFAPDLLTTESEFCAH